MRKILALFLITPTLFLTFMNPAFAADTPPAKGGVLPEIKLPIPKSPGEKGYLGLSGNGLFKIPQIKAKVVIIDVFSMYCPFCQKEAPAVNEIYRTIENSKELKNKIKLIGIGAGNSPFEVGVFKKTYEIQFPLFSDDDFAIHKALGEVRTPYYIAIKINNDGTHEVVHSQVGGATGAEPFLEKILKASGLK